MTRWIGITFVFLCAACTQGGDYSDSVAMLSQEVLTPVGEATIVQRATVACVLQADKQVCTDLSNGNKSCKQPVWAVLAEEEKSFFVGASHFAGTDGCEDAAQNPEPPELPVQCIPPQQVTPELTLNDVGESVFDCGSITRDLDRNNKLVNKRVSFYDQVVAYIDAPADFLPVGQSTQCSGSDKVQAIDVETGDVICAPDVVGESGISTVIGEGGLQSSCTTDDCVVSIAANGVNSSHILNGTITGSDIATGTIQGSDIADGTVTGSDIANGTITGTDIATGTITSTDIANNTITGTDILNGTITGSDIASNTITGTDIAAGGVGPSNLANNAFFVETWTNPPVFADDSPNEIRSQYLGSLTARFCFLASVEVEDLDNDNESARCSVIRAANGWYLEAAMGPGTNDGEVRCRARCILWGTQAVAASSDAQADPVD
ncbi:MAG: hypothetical protein Tsb0020_37770 [Haliangiales bacterium]